MELFPKFEKLLSPEEILRHLEELKNPEPPLDTSRHLAAILNQLKPLDFRSLAFPEVQNLYNQAEKETDKPDDEKKMNQKLERQLEKFRVQERHYQTLGMEELLRVANSGSSALCSRYGNAMLFNGKFMETISPEQFGEFLISACIRMGMDPIMVKYYRFQDNMLRQFHTQARYFYEENHTTCVLVNLQNGTFVIDEAGNTRLKLHDKADYLTYCLPFAYDPSAQCPLFDAFLDRVLPDREKQQVLEEYLGYIFCNNGSENSLKIEKALILYGTGANGKSVIFEIVNALLGEENVCNYSMRNIANENGYYRAMLVHKLVNYASELDGKMEVDIFKKLVSGEPVDARLPYGEPMIIRNYAKLIFNCNVLPQCVENSNAWFRRFLILHFDVQIPEAEQDRELHKKITANELSGIFNRVLAGLDRLVRQRRFSPCASADKILGQYRTESNSVLLFLEDSNYVTSTDSFISLKNIYSEYRDYCYLDGITPIKKLLFKRQIMAAGITASVHAGTNQRIIWLKKNA